MRPLIYHPFCQSRSLRMRLYAILIFKKTSQNLYRKSQTEVVQVPVQVLVSVFPVRQDLVFPVLMESVQSESDLSVSVMLSNHSVGRCLYPVSSRYLLLFPPVPIDFLHHRYWHFEEFPLPLQAWIIFLFSDFPIFEYLQYQEYFFRGIYC